MPAATMFSKFKSGNQAPQNPIEANPITQYFEISKPVACAGPELVWKIHDAYRKSDGKVEYMQSWPPVSHQGIFSPLLFLPHLSGRVGQIDLDPFEHSHFLCFISIAPGF